MNRTLLGAVCGVCLGLGLQARADSDGGLLGSHHPIKHVLLISVDGLHALDLSNYVKSHPDSNLAELEQAWCDVHEQRDFLAVGLISRTGVAGHGRLAGDDRSVV